MEKSKNIIKIKARKKRRRRHFKIGENEKEIIKMIGLGTLVIASFVLPNLPIILKPLLKEQGPSGLGKILQRLNRKKIVYLGGEKIQLTSKGKKLFKNIQISEIAILPPKKWDGVWHLISYDIPNEYNKERDYFRENLKRMMFYQIQKSLWVHPYECKEEIAVIAEYFKIAEYVIVMNTDYLPNEEEIEEIFHL